MILVEHTDNKQIKVRMEFADTHELGSELMAFLDAVCESEIILDVFTRVVDARLNKTKDTRK